MLHLAWVDDATGDSDIYYGYSDGMPEEPLVGVNLVDDTSGADQLAPTLIVGTDCDNEACVFGVLGGLAQRRRAASGRQS